MLHFCSLRYVFRGILKIGTYRYFFRSLFNCVRFGVIWLVSGVYVARYCYIKLIEIARNKCILLTYVPLEWEEIARL